MKILYLGGFSPLIDYLSEQNELCVKADAITLDFAKEYDFIVSYAYRHIIKPDIVEAFDRRAVNLHIAYLPYNRGSDPNLWSFLENTIKGVSIHYIDEGLDTGDIIAQKVVEFYDTDTLATSYGRLKREIEQLFIQWWPKIQAGRVLATVQGAGTYHCSEDKEPFDHLLKKGFDTLVCDLM